MPTIQKLHKWHFLLLGCLLVALSAYLWYWGWRLRGIPCNLCPETYLILAAYILGVFVLGLFIYRLTLRQVTIMLVGMVLVNLLAALLTVWISRNLPAYFDQIRPRSLIESDPQYIRDWWDNFLKPALYLLHGGLLLLWAESLIMFLIRKPTDEPG